MESSCQKFGLDLLKSISLGNFDQNIIYSPMSIYFALGMTLCGARADTLQEMVATLHWDSNHPESYHKEISKMMVEMNEGKPETGIVKIANKLFMEKTYSLLDTFKKVIKEGYDGGVDLVDFKNNPEKSRQFINSWVEVQTEKKIKDLLASGTLHSLTRLLLVNAVYFKGSWRKEFSKVGKQDFHLLNKSTKSVEMIEKTNFFEHLENKTIGFSAVQIPFNSIGNHNYSMMIILPNEKGGLPQVEKAILEKDWNSVLGHSLFEEKNVDVIMPKFRIESSYKLKDILQSLGMVRSFSDSADFSGMTGHKDLIIDDVVHKAFIDVDEHGVEAAAATAVMMMLRCALISEDDPIEFHCDHPFMYALMRNGSFPLFVGHLVSC